MNHPLITINGWYKPSKNGVLLLLYPHYGSMAHLPCQRYMAEGQLANITSAQLEERHTRFRVQCALVYDS